MCCLINSFHAHQYSLSDPGWAMKNISRTIIVRQFPNQVFILVSSLCLIQLAACESDKKNMNKALTIYYVLHKYLGRSLKIKAMYKSHVGKKRNWLLYMLENKCNPVNTLIPRFVFLYQKPDDLYQQVTHEHPKKTNCNGNSILEIKDESVTIK